MIHARPDADRRVRGTCAAQPGGALDAKLNMPDEVAIGCVATDPGLPADKLVFMELQTHTLELIDLSGKNPERRLQ